MEPCFLYLMIGMALPSWQYIALMILDGLFSKRDDGTSFLLEKKVLWLYWKIILLDWLVRGWYDWGVVGSKNSQVSCQRGKALRRFEKQLSNNACFTMTNNIRVLGLILFLGLCWIDGTYMYLMGVLLTLSGSCFPAHRGLSWRARSSPSRTLICHPHPQRGGTDCNVCNVHPRQRLRQPVLQDGVVWCCLI